ncbi:T9SS type A sorting domain-containing protein [bacterium]|nr:T9SS type A sorting domain-containing protein [bacterium]
MMKLFSNNSEYLARFFVLLIVSVLINSAALPVYAIDRIITGAEYFIDVDPGIGNGVAIEGEYGDSTASIEIQNIETADLTPGMHTIYVRFAQQDTVTEVFNWGETTGYLFHVALPSDGQEISAAEYFIDSDPGEGNGIPLEGAFNNSTVEAILENIETSALETGTHTVYVRFQRFDNIANETSWGSPQGILLNVSSPENRFVVGAAEYFIDDDPGEGNGVALEGEFNQQEVEVLVGNIDSEELATGTHTVYTRFQLLDTEENRTQWGEPVGKLLNIASPLDHANIVAAEMFIDDDPGVGNAIPLTGDFGDSLETALLEDIPTDELSTGTHSVYVRFQKEDHTGELSWGESRSRLLNIAKPNRDVNLIAAEYYIDNDPGFGNGIPLQAIDGEINDSSETFQSMEIPTADLPLGRHLVIMRIQDSDDLWSEQRVAIINVEHIPQRIPLTPDYFELISMYMTPFNPDARQVFGQLESLRIVYENNGHLFIPPNLNTIGDISIDQGYYLYSTEAETLIVRGLPADSTVEYNLSGGSWKWLSYPKSLPMNVEVALDAIEEELQIIIADDGRFWVPPVGLNTMGDMLPGEGYKVFFEDDVVFQYPFEEQIVFGVGNQNYKALDSKENPDQYSTTGQLELPRTVDAPLPTGLPFLVLFTMSQEVKALNPAIIELYDGRILVGKSVIIDDLENSPVIAWEADWERGLSGFTRGNSISLRLLDASGDEIDNVIFSDAAYDHAPWAQIAIDVASVTIPYTFNVGKAYPNPFNPSFTLPFSLPESGNVILVIYNTLGQVVYETTLYSKAGHNHFTYNMHNSGQSNFSSGVYIVKMHYKNEQSLQKVILLQ